MPRRSKRPSLDLPARRSVRKRAKVLETTSKRVLRPRLSQYDAPKTIIDDLTLNPKKAPSLLTVNQVNNLAASCGLSVRSSNISGLGVFYESKEDLPANKFLGYYIGEILHNAEPERLQQSDYIIAAGNSINIDARDSNHILRYINDDLRMDPDDADFKAFCFGDKVGIYTTKVFKKTNRGYPKEKILSYGFEYWYPNRIHNVLNFTQVLGFHKSYGNRVAKEDKVYADLVQKATLDMKNYLSLRSDRFKAMNIKSCAKRRENSKKYSKINKKAFTY